MAFHFLARVFMLCLIRRSEYEQRYRSQISDLSYQFISIKNVISLMKATLAASYKLIWNNSQDVNMSRKSRCKSVLLCKRISGECPSYVYQMLFRNTDAIRERADIHNFKPRLPRFKRETEGGRSLAVSTSRPSGIWYLPIMRANKKYISNRGTQRNISVKYLFGWKVA